MRYQQSYSVEKRLTKSNAHKKLSGVCAGIAAHYELPRLAVRVGAIVALVSFPMATGVAYIVASLLMPSK